MSEIDKTVEDLAADESFQNWVNRANVRDTAYWDAWLDAHPQHRERANEAALTIRTLQSLRKKDIAHRKKDLIIEDLQHRLLQPPQVPVRKMPQARRWVRAAAAIALPLAAVALLYVYMANRSLSRYQAQYGETRELQLPDGSQVSLNANSGLTIKKSWESGSAREVWLDGEAFFSVAHKPSNQRFIVHTDNGDIVVLGTRFNVFTRRGKTQVVLSSGKVKVITRNAADTIFLEPGQMVEIVAGRAQEKKNVDAEKFTAWKRDTLSFDATTLLDVATLIKDNYGYEIVWSNERLKAIRFTYQFVGKDLDLLLATLSEALDLDIQKKENLIYISPR